ncbi:MAG: hypothetical protein R3D62_22740 [Xanthobacteraceae bacterium]
MNSNPITDRESAIRWFVRNRRADMSLEQAIRTLTFSLPRDMATMQSLQRIQREEEEHERDAIPNRSCLPGLPPRR